MTSTMSKCANCQRGNHQAHPGDATCTAPACLCDASVPTPPAEHGRRSPARTQFLTDVFTTAFEGGINYWASVRVFRWEDEQRGVLLDEEDDGREWTITLDTIARGITVLTAVDRLPAAFKLANRTNGADGDFDADDADRILQAGLFGQVVYG